VVLVVLAVVAAMRTSELFVLDIDMSAVTALLRSGMRQPGLDNSTS
jgi:hypothetical protein